MNLALFDVVEDGRKAGRYPSFTCRVIEFGKPQARLTTRSGYRGESVILVDESVSVQDGPMKTVMVPSPEIIEYQLCDLRLHFHVRETHADGERKAEIYAFSPCKTHSELHSSPNHYEGFHAEILPKEPRKAFRKAWLISLWLRLFW